MIKNLPKLPELRKAAEDAASCEAGERAWRRYAEALEFELRLPHPALLFDPEHRPGEEKHDERTEQSLEAHEAAREILTSDYGITTHVQIVWRPAAGLLYALEVRGQPSHTGHGRQGLNPVRGAILEELNQRLPAFLAFKDGNGWQTAWWNELPNAQAIANADPADKATGRFGWLVREFDKREELVLPERYDARPPAQGRLG